MSNARIEFLIDGDWQEFASRYQSLIYTDVLHHPQRISIDILNASSSELLNDLENSFTRYQKIRVIEGNTDNVLFFGRIDKITPKYDASVGQTLSIQASDNLMELTKNAISTNADYDGDVRRAIIIRDIINGSDLDGFIRHTQPGNINTNDLDRALENENISEEIDGSFLSRQLEGSKKNALRIIEEIASMEFNDSTKKFSYDYYLENPSIDNLDNLNIDTGVGVPAFKYFERAKNPDVSQTNTFRMNLGFRSQKNHNTRGIKPDYSFPRASDEIITKVRLEYDKNVPLSVEDEHGNIITSIDETVLEQQTVNCILVYVNDGHNLRRSGSLISGKVAHKAYWGSSNEGEAYILKIIEDAAEDEDGNTLDAILLADTPEGGPKSLLYPIYTTGTINQIDNTQTNINNNNIYTSERLARLETIYDSGYYSDAGGPGISGLDGTTILSATLNDIDDGNQPGSIRENIGLDVEFVIDSYEFKELAEAINRTAQILQQSRDEVIRGRVSILEYPYFSHTSSSNMIMLRAGMSINLLNIPGITNNTITSVPAIVTKITYSEGIGYQQSEIEVLVNTNDIGIGVPPNLLVSLAKQSETGRFDAERHYQNTRRTILRPNQQASSTWSFSGSIVKSAISPTDTINVSGNDRDEPTSPAILTLVNNSTYEIKGMSYTAPSDDSATYWLYFDTTSIADSDGKYSFQQSKNRSVVFSNSNIPIAWFKSGPDYVQFRMLGYPFHSLIAEPFSESILDHTVSGFNFRRENNNVKWSEGTIILTSGTEYTIQTGTFNKPGTAQELKTDTITPITAFEYYDTTIPSSDSSAVVDPASTRMPSTVELDYGTPDAPIIGTAFSGKGVDDSARFFVFFDFNKTPEEDGGDVNDISTNEYTLSISPNVNNAVGAGKIMLCVIKWEGIVPIITSYHDKETLLIDGGFIGANTITSNHIAANTITATEIQVGSLTADRLAVEMILSSEINVLTEPNIPDYVMGNYTRITIEGRQSAIRSPGIYGYFGDGNEDAVEQFKLDATTGQIMTSGNNARAILDGDGLIIETGTTNALQIIASNSSSREHYTVLEDVDGAGSFDDNVVGTLILGDSKNIGADNTSIIINKNRIALSNTSGGIAFFENSDNITQKLIQNPSGSIISGKVGSINISSDGVLNIEAFGSDTTTSSSGIHFNPNNGTITFTGTVALGDMTADFTNIMTNVTPALSDDDESLNLNIGSNTLQWRDLYLSNRLYFGADFISVSGTGDSAEFQLNGSAIGSDDASSLTYISKIPINMTVGQDEVEIGGIIIPAGENLDNVQIGGDGVNQIFSRMYSTNYYFHSNNYLSVNSDNELRFNDEAIVSESDIDFSAFDMHIIPTSDQNTGPERDLGSSSHRWDELHVDVIYVHEKILPTPTSLNNMPILGESGNEWHEVFSSNVITDQLSPIISHTDDVEGSVIGLSNGRWEKLWIHDIDFSGLLTGEIPIHSHNNYMSLGGTTERWTRHLIPLHEGDMASGAAWDLGASGNDNINRWRNIFAQNINITGDFTINGTDYAEAHNHSGDFISVTDSTQIITRDFIPDIRGADPNPLEYRDLGSNSASWGILYAQNINISGYSTIGHIGPISNINYDLGVYDNNGIHAIRRFRTVYAENININGDLALGSDTTIIGNFIPNTATQNIGGSSNPWNNLYINNIIPSGEIIGDLIPQTDAPELGSTINSSTYSIGGDSADNLERWNTLYVHNINASGLLSGSAFTPLDTSNFLSSTDSTQIIGRHFVPNISEVGGVTSYQNLGNGLGNRWGFLYVHNIDANGNSLFEHIGPQMGGTYDLGVYDNEGDLTIRRFRTVYAENINIPDGGDIIIDGVSYAEAHTHQGNFLSSTDSTQIIGRHLIPVVGEGITWSLGSLTGNARWSNIFAQNINASGQIILSGNINSNLLPEGTNKTLGSSSAIWSELNVLTIAGDSSNIIAVDSHLLPVSAGGWNLGSGSEEWVNLFTEGILLSGEIKESTTAEGITVPDIRTHINSQHISLNSDGRIIQSIVPQDIVEGIETASQNLGEDNINRRWGTLWVQNINTNTSIVDASGGSVDIGNDSGGHFNDIYISGALKDENGNAIISADGGDVVLDENNRVIRDWIPQSSFDITDTEIASTLTLGNPDNLYRWATLYVRNIDMLGDFTINGNIVTNLIPEGSINLGSSDNEWQNIYANAIITNSISVDAFTPTSAAISLEDGHILFKNSNSDIYVGDSISNGTVKYAYTEHDHDEDISQDLIPIVRSTPSGDDVIITPLYSLGSEAQRWLKLWVQDIDAQNINVNALSPTSSAITIVDGHILFNDEDSEIYIGDSISGGTIKYAQREHDHGDSFITLDTSGNINQHLIPTGIPEEDNDNEIVSYTPQWDLGGNINNILSSWRNLYVENIYFTGNIYEDGEEVTLGGDESTIDLSAVAQNIIPATNDTYNLGSQTLGGFPQNAWSEINTYDLNIFGTAGLRLNSGDIRLVTGDVLGATGNTAKYLTTSAHSNLEHSLNIPWTEIPSNLIPTVGVRNIGNSGLGRWDSIFGASLNLTGSINLNTNIIPNALDTSNLGSDGNRWNNLYINGSIIKGSTIINPDDIVVDDDITTHNTATTSHSNIITAHNTATTSHSTLLNETRHDLLDHAGLTGIGGDVSFTGIESNLTPDTTANNRDIGLTGQRWNRLYLSGPSSSSEDAIHATIGNIKLGSGDIVTATGDRKYSLDSHDHEDLSIDGITSNDNEVIISRNLIPDNGNRLLGGSGFSGNKEWDTLFVGTIGRYSISDSFSIIVRNHLVPFTTGIDLGTTISDERWDNLHVNDIIVYNDIRDGNSESTSNYYLKHREVTNEAAYDAITNKDSNILYWWEIEE